MEEPQEESEEVSLEQTRSPEYPISASTDEVGIQATPTYKTVCTQTAPKTIDKG